jgi:hypothetical protein
MPSKPRSARPAASKGPKSAAKSAPAPDSIASPPGSEPESNPIPFEVTAFAVALFSYQTLSNAAEEKRSPAKGKAKPARKTRKR